MFEDYFQNYDPSYTLLFHAHWSDWEEDGWIFVFEKDGKYFCMEGGYCVMATDHSLPIWERDLQSINEEGVLQLMEEWAEHEE